MVLRNIAILSFVAIALFTPATAQAQETKVPSVDLRSESFLPADTRAWCSIPSTKMLSEHLSKGQFGQLTKDPALQPFVESARKQIRRWLDDKQIGFDVKLDQFEEINAGEVCVAGVLPEAVGGQTVAGSHGVILMANVAKDLQGAKKLLGQIEQEQTRRGAKKIGVVEINGIQVDKWQFANNRKWAKRKRISMQAIVGDWMLLSDNEKIFRSVLRRIIKLNPAEKGNLANRESFKSAMEGAVLPSGSPNDIRWYVEPFGYVKLARAIEIENEPVKKMQDDWTAVLAKNGLRAIRSVAGSVSVSTEGQEALFRVFVFAPKDKTRSPEEKRMLDILDFSGGGTDAMPPAWVPGSVSGSLTAHWNFSKALNGIGPIVDSFMKEEGAFDGLLDTIRTEPDFRVDIPKLVGQLDNKFTIISAVKRPIEADSEKLALGIKLKPGLSPQQQAEILASIGRAVRGKDIELGGIKAIEDDRTEEPDELDDFDGGLPFEDEDEEKFGDGGEGDEGFALFEQKFIAIAKDHLFVSNDKRFLKMLLTSSDKKPVTKRKDFNAMKAMLASLSDEKKVITMRFGRIDKILELNYEMLRKGELVNSKSLIGRIVNEMITNNEDNSDDKLTIDISKLPKKYSDIAKYFGTMGWVVEDETSGWRLTGCVLK